MRIARMSAAVLAALCVCLMATVVIAAPTAPTIADDAMANALTLVYDPAGGTLGVVSPQMPITTLQIESTAGKFIPAGVAPGVFTGMFDVKTNKKLFKMDPAGYGAEGTYNLGAVLPTGLTGAALVADLKVDGSWMASGGLPAGNFQSRGVSTSPLLVVVPEPSSVALLALGLLGLVGLRRR